jgi:hypothetical protein
MTPCFLKTLVSLHSKNASSARSTILVISACDVSGTRVKTLCVEGSWTSMYDSTPAPVVHSPPMRFVVLPARQYRVSGEPCRARARFRRGTYLHQCSCPSRRRAGPPRSLIHVPTQRRRRAKRHQTRRSWSSCAASDGRGPRGHSQRSGDGVGAGQTWLGEGGGEEREPGEICPLSRTAKSGQVSRVCGQYAIQQKVLEVSPSRIRAAYSLVAGEVSFEPSIPAEERVRREQ